MNETGFDMWKGLETKRESTVSVCSFLQDQAEGLSSATDGKVKARIVGVSWNPAIGAVLKTLSKVGTGYTASTDEEEDLEDIGIDYHTEHYSFEICNDRYKFRVFTVGIRPFFPIDVDIDEDIENEDMDVLRGNIIPRINSNGDTDYQIDSMKQLESFLGAIARTRKVQHIVSRLKEAEEEKIRGE